LTRQITLRTVFGVAALREKLVAWESGIDDAVVAALSLQILRDGMRSLRPEVRPRLVQVAPQALVFQGSEGEHWELPRERYDEALVSPYWVDVVDALSAGTYVDPGRVLFR